MRTLFLQIGINSPTTDILVIVITKAAPAFLYFYWLKTIIINNYSPKWRWIVVDICRAAAARWGDTEVNNCFSIYHTSWITSGPKSNFICDNIPTKAILFFFRCSEVNSTWLITSELANQRARKVLFTCVVYTNINYYLKSWTYSISMIDFHRVPNRLRIARVRTTYFWEFASFFVFANQ